jgi:hypothetical protein
MNIKPRGTVGEVKCPFNPNVDSIEFMAWHRGFTEGAKQANAIWSSSFPVREKAR